MRSGFGGLRSSQARARFIGRVAGVLTLALVASWPASLGSRQAAGPDGFAFLDGRGQAHTVTLEPRGLGLVFDWPAAERWDTALLSVSVSATGALPFVGIEAGVIAERQYLRTGETATRWINLSALQPALEAGTRVTVTAIGATIASGPATLRLFSSRPDLSKPLLVLAPHPDDAEIAAFALYADRTSTVVTVTAGNAGSRTYEAVYRDPAEQYREKGRLRVMDSATVPWHGGIPPARTFNLGYFDARLARMHDAPTEIVPEMYAPNTDVGVYRQYNLGTLLPKGSRPSSWVHLVDDLVEVLRKVKPAAVAAPHPQLDTHLDHAYTTVALAEALDRWTRPVTLLLYTNHADGNRYPYGPAGTAMSLPPAPSVPVVFDRIWSLPVPPPLQQRKLFALEAMHDLRYTPTRQYQLAVGDDRALAAEPIGPGPDITYLRRGPRSNELFYVYDRDSVRPVIDAFLAARRPSR